MRTLKMRTPRTPRKTPRNSRTENSGLRGKSRPKHGIMSVPGPCTFTINCFFFLAFSLAFLAYLAFVFRLLIVRRDCFRRELEAHVDLEGVAAFEDVLVEVADFGPAVA